MKGTHVALMLVLLLAVAPSARASDPFRCKGCSIIFIQCDTLRFDHTSPGGASRDVTPNLTRLAAHAVVFKNAVSGSTWCVPGNVSLMTAMYPSSHGVVNKFVVKANRETPLPLKLSPSIKLLPELLKPYGYKVAGFVSGQDVDSYTNLPKRLEMHATGEKLSRFSILLPQAAAWIEGHRTQKFFVFIHGYEPHGAVDPHGGYKRTYDPSYAGTLTGAGTEYTRLREQEIENKMKHGSFHLDHFSERDARFYNALYDERIHRMDEMLGAFFERLKRSGVLRHTIVVLASDHGDEFLEHGAISHGHSLYEELLRVPMVMWFPHLGRGQVVSQLVRNFDVLPTVLDAVGVKVADRDGVSLLPVLHGHFLKLTVYPETDFLLATRRRCVRDSHWSFIRTEETGKVELYDLTVDAAEKHNIAALHPALVQAYGRQLDAHLRACKGSELRSHRTHERFLYSRRDGGR